MSEHIIKCWSCGTSKTLNEIRTADGYCPECDVEIDLAEYYPKLAEDHDALHAEAEALQKRLTTEQGNAAYWKEQYQALRNDYQRTVSEKVGLSTELEAERGLLREARPAVAYESHRGDEAGRQYQITLAGIDAFLTATPAPEVQAEQGERQEALPLFTCSGKGGEYARLGYAKPAGALKAIQGDSGLIIYRDTNGGQLYFRDPRDFEERMSPLAVIEPFSLGGDVIRQRTTADTTPQPGPDVRGLVRAGQQMANSCYNLSQFEIIGDANVKAQLRDLAKGWDEALTANRQAQRND